MIPLLTAVTEALSFAEQFGQTDGAHHKQWVIDQMVRKLTGTHYEKWRADYEASGVEWDEGIAP